MHPLPHRYAASAEAGPATTVTLGAAGLPPLSTDAPPAFGGPEGKWSPETLLVAAAADCFVLTFRAIASASKLPWTRCECDAEGVLDRAGGGLRFTALHLRARLELPTGSDAGRARRLLEKAETSCLITRSLALTATLDAEVVVAGEAEAAAGA